MTREEAKQSIATYCGTTIESSRENEYFCSFSGFLFSVGLLSRPRKIGFHYYSNVALGDESAVMGPWMQSILRNNGFLEKECQVRTNRSTDREGHVADFYLDIDWEILSKDNLETIKKLYDRLRTFQENVWPASENERIQAIRKYNEAHLDEVRQYVQNRIHAQLEVSDTTPKNESSQIGTTEGNFMINEIKTLLESNLQVILTGAPGTGKTYTAKQVACAKTGDDEKAEIQPHIESVQFHPGYDYSDFVIGMKPVLLDEYGKEVKPEESRTGKLQVSFRWKDGILKTFAAKAKSDPDHNYVFLIDEINRADLSRVFGELFSLLEEEYRYPKNKKGVTLPNGETFVIPRNLFIIGTMNDIDRSVENMDFALRRRFAWKEVRAKDTQKDIFDAKKTDGSAKIDPIDAEKLKKAMDALNFEIAGEEVDGKKPTLDLRLGPEYELGGAIFAKFEKCGDFNDLWKNHIEIILNEYLRGRKEKNALLKSLNGLFFESVGMAATQTAEGTGEP